MTQMTFLNICFNVITSLPPGIFDKLTKLQTLYVIKFWPCMRIR